MRTGKTATVCQTQKLCSRFITWTPTVKRDRRSSAPRVWTPPCSPPSTRLWTNAPSGTTQKDFACSRGGSCIRITSPRCHRRTRRKFSPAVADLRVRISSRTSTSLAGFSTESIPRVGPRATIRSYRTSTILPTSSRKRRCAKSIFSAV